MDRDELNELAKTCDILHFSRFDTVQASKYLDRVVYFYHADPTWSTKGILLRVGDRGYLSDSGETYPYFFIGEDR